MKYQFFTCDVFTDVRFGGNPLAVLPNADGLSSQQMQQIAREFNYSETTFVFPGHGEFTRKVRIFTPTQEVPFAGHPNIGTAFTLASTGALGDFGDQTDVLFDEIAGPVAITIRRVDSNLSCELKAPQSLVIGDTLAIELVASALSLTPDDIDLATHAPRVASVGLPFCWSSLKIAQRCKKLAPICRLWSKYMLMVSCPTFLFTFAQRANLTSTRGCLHPLMAYPKTPQLAAPTARWRPC